MIQHKGWSQDFNLFHNKKKVSWVVLSLQMKTNSWHLWNACWKVCPQANPIICLFFIVYLITLFEASKKCSTILICFVKSRPGAVYFGNTLWDSLSGIKVLTYLGSKFIVSTLHKLQIRQRNWIKIKLLKYHFIRLTKIAFLNDLEPSPSYSWSKEKKTFDMLFFLEVSSVSRTL